MTIAEPKLYMLLVGCRPPGRHTEQHDVYFGIASSLKELLPQLKTFWPEGKRDLHIDAWREVTFVDGFSVSVVPKQQDNATSTHKLFFINLGGYQPGRFEEQHHIMLTAQPDKAAALKAAKQTPFFKTNGFRGATSHIDDKYSVAVDDLFDIRDILPVDQRDAYEIVLTPTSSGEEDELHLGYLRLDKVMDGM